MEPDEGLERLADALKICGLFKNLFFEKKAQLSKYFKEQPVVEWDFKSSLVFARMDVFTNQMKLIEVLLCCSTVCIHTKHYLLYIRSTFALSYLS